MSAYEAGPENMQKITGNLGLSFVLEPQHLDPTHRVIAVVDAPSIEAVSQFVFDTGLFQWNTVENPAYRLRAKRSASSSFCRSTPHGRATVTPVPGHNAPHRERDATRVHRRHRAPTALWSGASGPVRKAWNAT